MFPFGDFEVPDVARCRYTVSWTDWIGVSWNMWQQTGLGGGLKP